MTSYTEKETLLKVEGINKKYDVPVLRDISFEVKNLVRSNCHQGQIVSLIGKSGSGKSTLFRIMAGLEKPDAGNVLVDAELKPVKEGDMGVVLQTSYVYPWRTVRKILELAVGKNESVIDKDAAIAEIAESLDITKLLKKYPAQLSGGQKQRAAIAEQILNGGNFILLDEPFSGLDTLTIDKVLKILMDLALTNEYKTVVVVSHDLSNSLAISDTAFILAKQESQEGATITQKLDLAKMGMAWREDIKEDIAFRELLKHVKTLL